LPATKTGAWRPHWDALCTLRKDRIRADWTVSGPLADLAQLVGEVVAVERLPVNFTVEGGSGRITIGALADAQLAPYIGATGQPTTLNESLFTTIPGSPAYVGKADFYRLRVPELGIDLNLAGHNAIQGQFRFAA